MNIIYICICLLNVNYFCNNIIVIAIVNFRTFLTNIRDIISLTTIEGKQMTFTFEYVIYPGELKFSLQMVNKYVGQKETRDHQYNSQHY